MTNLTLTKSEFWWALRAAGISTAGIFVVCLSFTKAPATDWGLVSSVFRALGWATTLTTLFVSLFAFWGWKKSWISSWHNRPVLHGVWVGDLQSSFSNGTTVPIVFVIQQSYLTISIQSLTSNQEGKSQFEAFLRDDRTTSTSLGYVFELKTRQAGEIALVRGAGDLQVLQDNTVLDGTYFTNSVKNTHGTLKLFRVSENPKEVSTFSDATRWRDANGWIVLGGNADAP